MDVLDSNDWLAEQRECRFISDEDKCVWQNYKDIVLEGISFGSFSLTLFYISPYVFLFHIY